jgi:ABC-2 type transport system ATP-binding protein
VSFAIGVGEIVGFLGPNGAGKTTTLRMLTGFLPPTSGSARVAGFDVVTESMQVRSRIGYLPETVPLYRDLPVSAYLEFVGALKGIRRGDRPSRLPWSTRAESAGSRAPHRNFLSRGFASASARPGAVERPRRCCSSTSHCRLDPKQSSRYAS